MRARQRRWSSLRIAQHLQLPVSTVVTALRRARLNRLARLEPLRPVVRYEAARVGGPTRLPRQPVPDGGTGGPAAPGATGDARG